MAEDRAAQAYEVCDLVRGNPFEIEALHEVEIIRGSSVPDHLPVDGHLHHRKPVGHAAV